MLFNVLNDEVVAAHWLYISTMLTYVHLYFMVDNVKKRKETKHITYPANMNTNKCAVPRSTLLTVLSVDAIFEN